MTSESVPCKDNPDGLMFTEMDLDNIIEVGDCMGLDGGYTLFIKQVLKNTKGGYSESLDICTCRLFCLYFIVHVDICCMRDSL